MMIASTAHADWRDPNEPFNASKKITNKSTITLITSDKVQELCSAENIKRGGKAFGYSIEACSFWTGDQCTIITKANPTIHDYGHEMRHCFHGVFH